MTTDKERIDWLAAREGTNLISDDGGRWAVSGNGFQPVPRRGGFKDTVQIASIVEPHEWHKSIRKALDAAMKDEP